MSPLRDFVVRDSTLSTAFESSDIGVAFLSVFGACTGVYALTPKVETAALQFPSHHFDDLRFTQSKLQVYRFEWRAVFPGHFDDPIEVSIRQSILYHQPSTVKTNH